METHDNGSTEAGNNNSIAERTRVDDIQTDDASAPLNAEDDHEAKKKKDNEQASNKSIKTKRGSKNSGQ